MMKKQKAYFLATLLSVLFVVVALAGCGNTDTTAAQTTAEEGYDTEDYYTAWSEAEATLITLEGKTVTIDGEGAKAEGSSITISTAGTYVLSGSLDDGKLTVTAGENDLVRIVLNGANLSCSSSAPINVTKAEKVVVSLEAGTENSLSDGTAYTSNTADSDEPNACLFSKEDLSINGSGTLNIRANYNNGITSKDTLKIMEGTYNITSADDALMGRDNLKIHDGNLTINAGGDGLKATNADEAEKGNVVIDNGTLDIVAGTDGIQAVSALKIQSGSFKINTGGGSENASTKAGGTWGSWGGGAPGDTTAADTSDAEDSSSAKGLKATGDITINGGNFDMDTSDDALHSNGTASINGGNFAVKSGDDGFHADVSLTFNDGTVNLTKSYEGYESANITIAGGTHYVVASDDGINVAGGNDASAQGGRPGENTTDTAGNSQLLNITGGYTYVDAAGDGLDANGGITMSGGTVIVNGPTDSGNGALDYDSTFDISGGTLIAAGAAGMAQTTSESSSQCAINVSASGAAGTLVNLCDAEGKSIVSFAPAKAWSMVLISTPEIKNGSSYTVSIGGSDSGSSQDGLYTGGTYSGGTALGGAFTVSGSVMSISESGASVGGSNGQPGSMPGGGGRGGAQRSMPGGV